VPGPLGIHVGVDHVRDGGVGAAGLVLVDQRGAFAVVTAANAYGRQRTI